MKPSLSKSSTKRNEKFPKKKLEFYITYAEGTSIPRRKNCQDFIRPYEGHPCGGEGENPENSEF